MKWLFFGVCGLAVLIFVLTTGDREVASVKAPDLTTTSTNANEQELRAENLKLREQIIQLNKEMAQLKHLASGNNSSQRVATTSQASNASVEPVKIQAKIQEFNNFLTSSDSISVLKTSFANEVVDSSWATNHQHELEAFFKKSFTDVFPQYIECRSKRCKITVPVFDQKKFAELSQALIQNTLNNNDGIAKKIVIEPTENDGTLNFYLARNDEISFLQ